MNRPWPDAFVILTGGRGSRLGGADKAGLEIGGVSLLQRALRVCGDRPVIVVGAPEPETDRRSRGGPAVTVVREDPPFGGPAAGLAAALPALEDGLRPDSGGDERERTVLIGVWAVDQVGVGRTTWSRLVAAAHGSDVRAAGVVLSAAGRRQYGAGLFALDRLRDACATRPSWHGASLRALLDPVITGEVPASSAEARDVDTLDDLEWWRRRSVRPADGTSDPSTGEGEAT